MSRGGASFILPSRRMSPIYAPDSQYRYLERIDTFTAPRFRRVSVLITNFLFYFLLTNEIKYSLNNIIFHLSVIIKMIRIKKCIFRNQLIMSIFDDMKHLQIVI